MSRGRPVGSTARKLTKIESEIVCIILEAQFGKKERYPTKQYDWAKRIVWEFPGAIEKYSKGLAKAPEVVPASEPPVPHAEPTPTEPEPMAAIKAEPVKPMGMPAATKTVTAPKPEAKPEPLSDPLELVSMGTPLPEHVDYIPKIDPDYYFPPELLKLVCTEVSMGEHILLVGHRGTGKTSLPEQIAARRNQPVYRMSLNGQCSILDFMGQPTLEPHVDADGKGYVVTRYMHGVLPMAVKYGWWLILDEISYAEAHILACLNWIDRKPPLLMLKENGGERIPAHPNFRIFGPDNTAGCMQESRPLYPGTNVLSAAFIERFCVHEVDYMPADEEINVVVKKAGVTKKLATQLVDVANRCREAFKRKELTEPFSTRQLLSWAVYCKVYGDVMLAARGTIFGKVSPDDAKTIELMIKNCVSEKN